MAYTQEQQAADYTAMEAKYAAQLQQRLANGTITQTFFDQQMQTIRDGLPDPSDAYWQEFLATVGSEIVNPLTLANNDIAYAQGDVNAINDSPSAPNTALTSATKSLMSNLLAAFKNIWNGVVGTTELILILVIVAIIGMIFFRKPILRFLAAT